MPITTATYDTSAGLGCTKLFAHELGGSDIVSFNLYRTPAGEVPLRRAKGFGHGDRLRPRHLRFIAPRRPLS